MPGRTLPLTGDWLTAGAAFALGPALGYEGRTAHEWNVSSGWMIVFVV